MAIITLSVSWIPTALLRSTFVVVFGNWLISTEISSEADIIKALGRLIARMMAE